MTKPWDNEPTPITKQAVIDSHGHWTFELRDRMENLERRLRHAEGLLEDVLSDATIFYEEKTLNRIANHMEAARQEDGR